ncbi:MAG TPA: MFS transporter, partial [Candidatus Methanofastidiosa archaeon]|nr:MFS transporter [Candidatus Methanofastidiosa archaeon]
MLIPLIILDLGGNAGAVGLSSMLFSLVTIIATMVWGRFSDETDKRKPYIILGFLGATSCFFILAFATTYLQVVMVYAIMAFFMAAELPVTPLFLLRNVDKDRWNESFSRFNLICSWALTAGLVIGGISSVFFDSFYTALILSFITFLSVLMAKFGIKESTIDVNRSKMGIFPNHMLERKRFTPNFVLHIPRPSLKMRSNNRGFFIVIALLFTGSNFFFIPIIPYLKYMGIDDGLIFSVSLSNYIASSLVYALISRDMRSLGCLGLLRRGIITRLVMMLSMLACIMTISNHAFVIVFVFYMLMGAVWPHIYTASITFVSESSSNNNGGSLMGKYNAVSTFGLMIG